MSKEILTQDEIDALLAGLGDDEADEADAEFEAPLTERLVDGLMQKELPVDWGEWDWVSEDTLDLEAVSRWSLLEVTGSVQARGGAGFQLSSDTSEADAEEAVDEWLTLLVDALCEALMNVLSEDGDVADVKGGPLSRHRPEQWPDPEQVADPLCFSIQMEKADVMLYLWLPVNLVQEEEAPAGTAVSEPKDEPAQSAPVEDDTQPDDEPVTKSQPKRPVARTQFPPLRPRKTHAEKPRGSIEMLLDIPLKITVELGRTTYDIREILSLQAGSIIELDKQAGDPVDVLVNGKLVAKGEVVVVDERFAVRVTEIVSLKDRIRNLK